MSAKQQFAKLLEPGKIGQMTLKNRMVMPPMLTRTGSEGGYVTQRAKDYYEARARGGVGLVIVEIACVDAPQGNLSRQQLGIDDDKFLPGMKELAAAIKRHGARAALQLHHAGRQAQSSQTGYQPVAPSPIPPPGSGEMPRQLTEAEIARLVTCWAQAAGRAKKAGFDGVEVHGCHRYLVNQFLSAASNRRQDRYGGSVENRARFLVEILRAIREEVGREYPVWCRLNGVELGVEDGIIIDETMQTARMAEEAGADAINLSVYAGPMGIPPVAQRPGLLATTFQRWLELWLSGASYNLWGLEPGIQLPLAEAVKKVVSIPVLIAGRIDPRLAETALQQGRADFIDFGRSLIADPELPNKVISGRLDEIRACLYCGNCSGTGGVQCTVNPAAGREQECSITKAQRSKRVLVVGGGPAGIEAARVAALRGHKVQLYEKEPELGGQLLLAQIPPYKQRISELIRSLSKQIDRQGVEVHLATEVTADLIAKEAPDAVVVATGASSLIPDIRGVERENVVLAADVLTGRAKVGDRVAIIGGELVGCEVAEFLADAGKKVTLMRRGAELALNVHRSMREPLLHRLFSKEEITILTMVKYKEITGDGVVIIDWVGRERTIEADTVVLAAGAKPNTEILATLKGKVAEVYSAGDCVEPRNILESMREGYRIGQSL